MVCERHSNHFKHDFSSDLPALLWLDANRLCQVLNNLVTNAAKFTQGGTVTFSVHMAAGPTADCVSLRFSVADEGAGMTKEQQDMLIAPFKQGEEGIAQGGVGLGLFIVQQLLKKMEAELKIDSVPNQGSCFSFELVAKIAQETDMEQYFEDTAPFNINGSGHTVLVVDDFAEQREVICDLFNGYGFTTWAAANGSEAQALIAKHAFDLIITDQQMPLVSGNELLIWVREYHPNLPVILYSALPPDLRLTQGLKFDGTLFKSTNGTALMAEAKRVLDV